MSISSYDDILPLTMIVIGALVFSSALTRTMSGMSAPHYLVEKIVVGAASSMVYPLRSTRHDGTR